MNTTPSEALLYEAFVYGFPLYEVARTRARDAAGSGPYPPLAANTLRHDRALTAPQDRWITTPNNDTLYSRAWLDLSNGPVRLDVTALPVGRYWSIAFMDAGTRNFALVGQRLHGVGPVRILLTGPEGAAPEPGRETVHAPGHDVWLLGRWLVTGEEDLNAAHCMQDALTIQAAPPSSPQMEPSRSDDPANFLAVVAEQLRRNPPPAQDQALLARLCGAGILPQAADPWAALDRGLQAAWASRIGPFHDRLRQAMLHKRRPMGQWLTIPETLADPADARELCAAIALGGLGALDADEAFYAGMLADGEGRPLDGQHRYQLQVPRGGITAGAFWSLTIYVLEADGRKFLVPNPVRRYSIGDRTPGAQPAADGAWRILIQREMPASAADRAHWLPAPAGRFQLTLRAYHPSAALRQREAELPRLERVDAVEHGTARAGARAAPGRPRHARRTRS